MILLRLAGRWLCRQGWHAAPIWSKKRKSDAATIAAGSFAREMVVASGLLDLAAWIGWCPRCERAIKWASFDPRPAAARGRGPGERK